MLDIKFDTFPELKTERLLLRRVNASDAPAFFSLRSNPEVMRYIDRPPMQSEAEALALIEKINAGFESNDSILWILCYPDNPVMIGNICFWRMDKENHRAEIGYLLDPACQGLGLMSEAMNAALEYGFGTMRLHSVEANTNPANKASQRVLERAGFVQEAYFRENYYFDGKFLDSAIYSLITPFR